MPLVLYYTHCKLFVILIWKYCLINKIPSGNSLGNMLYVNKAQWCANTMNEWFMLERNKIMLRWCILVRNKLWTIVFHRCLGIGTKQERIPFRELERAVLMFYHELATACMDIENHERIFNTFFGNSYQDRRSLSEIFVNFSFNNIIVLILKRPKKCQIFQNSQSFSSYSLYSIVFIAAFNNNIHY